MFVCVCVCVCVLCGVTLGFRCACVCMCLCIRRLGAVLIRDFYGCTVFCPSSSHDGSDAGGIAQNLNYTTV